MTENRTITESELKKFVQGFVAGATEGTFEAAKYSLRSIGIQVVPDPMPEPEGDVIVKDRTGLFWSKGQEEWWVNDTTGMRWEELRWERGPIKVYRREGKSND